MADPYAKVIPGQRLSIPSAAWNKLMDVVKAPQGGGSSGGAAPAGAEVVRFVNDTGALIPKSYFVGLGDPVIKFATGDNMANFFANEKAFDGEVLAVADHADAGRFGIVLADTPDGDTGYCALSGIFPCKLNITAEADEYANIVDAQPEALDTQSGASTVRIWWKEAGTGTDKWGLVELGRASGGGGSTIKLVQAQADGAYGQVSVKDIILKSDLTASPNFETTGDAYNIAYLKV